MERGLACIAFYASMLIVKESEHEGKKIKVPWFKEVSVPVV